MFGLVREVRLDGGRILKVFLMLLIDTAAISTTAIAIVIIFFIFVAAIMRTS